MTFHSFQITYLMVAVSKYTQERNNVNERARFFFNQMRNSILLNINRILNNMILTSQRCTQLRSDR